MSLWNVDEASTVWLIERSFGYLQQGKNKLEVLRQARAEVRQAGYEHPFYWAPFILVGAR
jgi:CHAT domain-containing protein